MTTTSTTTTTPTSATAATTAQGSDAARLLAQQFIDFLETGVVADGLFAPDMFTDFTLPLWRLQADTADSGVALRAAGHPMVGRVPRHRLDFMDGGFVLEVEEQWETGDDEWYCRELFRADVVDGSIRELAVYCTGDWPSARVAEHRAAVRLLRP
ncbi:hypothetical protein [Kineosporia sp. R_H_3]|uniref:hypothetical protein n=1 Tax=Kineosporia sp. R_H_3 TaxID=1961848 RepID=UPI0018E9F72E|nr:hypothetical protein [Kineosporia sp. R_H_3]